MNELPTFTCWRCDSECDTTWVDVSRMDVRRIAAEVYAQ